MTPLFLLSTISITSQATVKCVLVWLRRPARCYKWGKIVKKNCCAFLVPRVVLCSRVAVVGKTQPRSQSSSAISDVTSPVKLVGKIRSRFQASSYNSDSVNWPGYEAGGDPLLFCLGTRLALVIPSWVALHVRSFQNNWVKKATFRSSWLCIFVLSSFSHSTYFF